MHDVSFIRKVFTQTKNTHKADIFVIEIIRREGMQFTETRGLNAAAVGLSLVHFYSPFPTCQVLTVQLTGLTIAARGTAF